MQISDISSLSPSALLEVCERLWREPEQRRLLTDAYVNKASHVLEPEQILALGQFLLRKWGRKRAFRLALFRPLIALGPPAHSVLRRALQHTWETRQLRLRLALELAEVFPEVAASLAIECWQHPEASHVLRALPESCFLPLIFAAFSAQSRQSPQESCELWQHQHHFLTQVLEPGTLLSGILQFLSKPDLPQTQAWASFLLALTDANGFYSRFFQLLERAEGFWLPTLFQGMAFISPDEVCALCQDITHALIGLKKMNPKDYQTAYLVLKHLQKNPAVFLEDALRVFENLCLRYQGQLSGIYAIKQWLEAFQKTPKLSAHWPPLLIELLKKMPSGQVSFELGAPFLNALKRSSRPVSNAEALALSLEVMDLAQSSWHQTHLVLPQDLAYFLSCLTAEIQSLEPPQAESLLGHLNQWQTHTQRSTLESTGYFQWQITRSLFKTLALRGDLLLKQKLKARYINPALLDPPAHPDTQRELWSEQLHQFFFIEHWLMGMGMSKDREALEVLTDFAEVIKAYHLYKGINSLGQKLQVALSQLCRRFELDWASVWASCELELIR